MSTLVCLSLACGVGIRADGSAKWSRAGSIVYGEIICGVAETSGPMYVVEVLPISLQQAYIA